MKIRIATLPAAVLMLPLVVGCGGGSSDDSPAAAPSGPTVLEEAHETCGAELQEGLEDGEMADEGSSADFVALGDEGRSLTLGNAPQGGDVSAMLTLPAMVCLLEETDAPDSVFGRVQQTRALDGRQSVEYGGLSVSWSYHPDVGVSAVFEETSGR